MDEYTVEDIVVSLTTDEYNKIIEAIQYLDNEGYDVPDSLYVKFQPQEDNSTTKWWEPIDAETTDQPQGD